MQGCWNWPVGEYFDLYTVPQAGLTVTLGRPVKEDS